MICISVTPTSRQLAKVDILNASRNCDLVEICLDHLAKEPNLGELMEGIDKPILISCRRQQDGGRWQGTEEQRLQLLRQAIVAEPEYVELDLDIARSIPRFGKTKRVISYVSIDQPLGKIDTYFDEAYKAGADVVKFTWPTPTLEAAWPLLHAVSSKRELPVVGVGLGNASVTFSLMGRKYGSPWIYAALEKGMEAHPGQATLWDLNELWHWDRITPKTRFLGVVGDHTKLTGTVHILNEGFKTLGIEMLCLPIEVNQFDRLDQMLEILKVKALLIAPKWGEKILPFSNLQEDAVKNTRYADLLVHKPEGWQAYNSIWRSSLKLLEDTLRKSQSDDRPLDRRNVMIIGQGGVARSLAYGVQRRKGIVSVSSPDDKGAGAVAQSFAMRHVPYAQLYDTLADVVVIAEPEMKIGHGRTEFNPAYLRSHMTVADVTQLAQPSGIVQEARQRGCQVVETDALYRDFLSSLFKAVTGKELPAAAKS